MKTLAVAAALLFAAGPLAVLAPDAAAFGWCSAALNPVRDPDCGHLVCYVPNRDHATGRETCQFSEDDLPDPCHRLCGLP